ncbi:hypothetical protein ABW21_db0205528 [Orbilia brochopaga]|nr:hypothetical protein ABW21_db0205528 [Drechslerella brochopaga]
MRLLQFIDRYAAICSKPLQLSAARGGKVKLPIYPLLVGTKMKNWHHFDIACRKTLTHESKNELPGLTINEDVLEEMITARLNIKSEQALSFKSDFSGPGIEIGDVDRILAFPNDISGKPNRWARLPVVYKPPWHISLDNMLDAFNANRFKGNEDMMIKSINQLATYMIHNDLKYGMLSTVKSAIALKITQIPIAQHSYQSRSVDLSVECSQPIHWGREGTDSPLAAYIYLSLLTYGRTELGRETLELRTKSKRKMPQPIPGLQEREIGKLLLYLTTPLAKKAGNTIRGRILEGETSLSIPAVFKVYSKLSRVQGKAIPQLYFADRYRGVLGIMALEDCGEPLTAWTPETIEHARRVLESVHKHDIVHQDIAMQNFVTDPKSSSSPVRLVGFGGAKERGIEGPQVLLEEMGNFMKLVSQQPAGS